MIHFEWLKRENGLSATSNHAKQVRPCGIHNTVLQHLLWPFFKLISEVFNRSIGITWLITSGGQSRQTMGIMTQSIFERWGRFV